MDAMEKQSGANPTLIQLATQIPSTAASESYAWLGSVPSVREWVGEKRAKQLKDYSYTLRNKDYEVSIEIDRNDLDDDQISAHNIRIADLVGRMRAQPIKMISDLVKNGTTGEAFDGSAFFANRSVNDNLLAGTGTTLAQLEADIDSTMQAMAAFKDDAGEALNIVPNVIVCPPALLNKFKKLVNSQASPTATAGVNTYNPYAGEFVVISDARLTDSNDWYAFCTTLPLKPFVFQTRKAAEPVFDDTLVKRTRMYYYSAEMRGNAGYGFPQLAAKVVNS